MQQDITVENIEPDGFRDHRDNTKDSLSSLTSDDNEDEMVRTKTIEGNFVEEKSPKGSIEVLDPYGTDNVAPNFPEGRHGRTVTPLPEATHSLTTSSLATQNDLIPPSPTPVSVWAAKLPVIEHPQDILPPSSPLFPHSPQHIFEIAQESVYEDENDHRIQETKDVFTDTQKIAYVGLCSVTSLEVVHECQGKDFAYARMSAGNWQRKLIRTLYMHMDITKDGNRHCLVVYYL